MRERGFFSIFHEKCALTEALIEEKIAYIYNFLKQYSTDF